MTTNNLPASNLSGEYRYRDSAEGCGHSYLLPAIGATLQRLEITAARAFDLGCGSGYVANWLSNRGFEVQGVDTSESGVASANSAFPDLALKVGSAYDELSEIYGQFPLVISLEVVEHLYSPRVFARTVHDLLQPGGIALISTPYHGYWKNLALALSGKLDSHFTALWDHGHIKFWSKKTISELLSEAGLEVCRIDRIGRIPPLAKTMLITARKPAPGQ